LEGRHAGVGRGVGRYPSSSRKTCDVPRGVGERVGREVLLESGKDEKRDQRER